MQLLAENRRLGTAAGRTSFSILLFQDLAVLPILFLVGAFGDQGEGSVVLAFAWAIGEAIIAVAIILALGRLVIRPLFRFIGSDASRETFLAFVLLVIIGTALATDEAGLSMALGAFLAGLLLAETEYRYEIEVDIDPFKGLLLGVFFASVGMGIDVTLIGQQPFWLIASAVGLFLLKSPIIYLLTRLFGQPRSVALESSLLLGQGGEFGFLVVGMALTLGLMPGDTAQFMLIVTGLTMIVTPLVAQAARWLASAVEAWEVGRGQGDGDVAADLSGHVIVAGYGRVGQMIGSILDDQELPHVGLDTDAQLVGGFRKEGSCVFYGDASRPDMLRKFGADTAAALVVTMDSPRAAEQVASTARRYWPELTIYARARDRDHANRLIAKGANHVIPETMEASLQLGEMVLTGAGVPEKAARRIIDIRRGGDQAEVDDARG
jgi:CPA2 family monovalent cation:H+ antiporter-2